MYCSVLALSVLLTSTIIIRIIPKVCCLTVQITYIDRVVWLVPLLGQFVRMAIIVRLFIFDQLSNELMLQHNLADNEAVIRFSISNSENDHWNAHRCLPFESDNCFCSEVKKLVLRIAVSGEEKFIWHNQNNGSYSCIENSITHRVYMQEVLGRYHIGHAMILLALAFTEMGIAIYAYWITKNNNSSHKSEDEYDETLISV